MNNEFDVPKWTDRQTDDRHIDRQTHSSKLGKITMNQGINFFF